jgi:hypothetical protein
VICDSELHEGARGIARRTKNSDLRSNVPRCGTQFCCQPLPGAYSRLPAWDLQPDTASNSANNAAAVSNFFFMG